MAKRELNPEALADLYKALAGLVSQYHGHAAACACPWCKARAALSKAEGR